MAIDFKRTFGNTAAPAPAAAAERQKAKFWLNIGYPVTVPVRYAGSDEVTEEAKFVSLPVGIPLDTMARITTFSRSDEYAQLQGAQNDLHEQLMAEAAKLNPGETVDINLVIQLRRVNEDRAEVPASENAFVRKLDLVG